MMTVINFIGNTIFIWLPIILFIILVLRYLKYKKQLFRNANLCFDKYVMLEISIPKEVHKSPKAMEFIIEVLHHLGGGVMKMKERYTKGSILFHSSLEIVSIEGSIYFFIRVHESLADLVKSTIYSQYPQSEVSEVDDYTKHVPNYIKNQNLWSLYGADYTLSNEQFIPIKTFVDYDLDKSVGNLEEYQKIDPISPMIEFLGTIGPGEQIWIQYIIRADVKSNWRAKAKSYIAQKVQPNKNADGTSTNPKLSPYDKLTIESIERGLSKHNFETVVRALYLAKDERTNPVIPGFFKGAVFKPFSSMIHNALVKNDDTEYKPCDVAKRCKFFEDYVLRRAFDSDATFLNKLLLTGPVRNPIIFSSEELATLFHFPSSVLETSSIERLSGVKSDSPDDLPI